MQLVAIEKMDKWKKKRNNTVLFHEQDSPEKVLILCREYIQNILISINRAYIDRYFRKQRKLTCTLNIQSC